MSNQVEILAKLLLPEKMIDTQNALKIDWRSKMSCTHKQYFKINVSFIIRGRIVGTNKIMDCESQICMCRKCGVLFVPMELRERPDLNSITELEK